MILQRRHLGLALSLASVLLFAVSPSLSHLAFTHGAGPLATGTLRGAMMTALFLPLFLSGLRRSGKTQGSCGPQHFRVMAALILGVTYAGFAWTYQAAIATTGAGLPLVCAAAGVILVVFWNAHVKPLYTGAAIGMPAGWVEFIAAIVTLSGVFILAGSKSVSGLGLLLCALSLVSCAAMTLATEYAAEQGVGARARSLSIGIGLMLLILPAALISPECSGAHCILGLALPADRIGWIAFLQSAVTMIGAVSLYSTAIGLIGAVRVALIANAEPAAGLLIAWLVFGEALTPVGILGAILACAGLIDWRLVFPAPGDAILTPEKASLRP